jgi:hypothetical protein
MERETLAAPGADGDLVASLDRDYHPELVNLIRIEFPLGGGVDIFGAGARMNREFLLPIDHEVAGLEKRLHLMPSNIGYRTERGPRRNYILTNYIPSIIKSITKKTATAAKPRSLQCRIFLEFGNWPSHLPCHHFLAIFIKGDQKRDSPRKVVIIIVPA